MGAGQRQENNPFLYYQYLKIKVCFCCLYSMLARWSTCCQGWNTLSYPQQLTHLYTQPSGVLQMYSMVVITCNLYTWQKVMLLLLYLFWFPNCIILTLRAQIRKSLLKRLYEDSVQNEVLLVLGKHAVGTQEIERVWMNEKWKSRICLKFQFDRLHIASNLHKI